jgi:hypothetical protein
VPLNRKSLLDAASSHGKEDRLTELLATVLDSHHELAAALFEELHLPVGERFAVLTQERVTRASRPDMLVHALDRGGSVVARVWSEHKLGSGFGDLQRERYLEALRELPGEGELIFIVRDGPTSREEGDWRGFTWQEVAELIDRVGRQWGQRGWRTAALAPDCPAKQRLLYELLWYLEDKDLAVVSALDDDYVLAYRLAMESLQAVGALLERAAQSATPLRPMHGGLGKEGITSWEQFETPGGTWLERFAGFEYGVDLVVSDRAFWSHDHRDEPAFAAGYSFESALHPALSARREWVRQLDTAGYCCELAFEWVHVYRTLPMRDIVGFGDSLQAQAQGVGKWAQAAIEELGQLDPGEVALPGRPGGGTPAT